MHDRHWPWRYSDERPIAVTIETGMTIENGIDLICHPSTRPEAVRAVRVDVRRSASGELRLVFRLDGDIPRIQIPSPGVPRIGAQLWYHTCFEAFIALAEAWAALSDAIRPALFDTRA